MALLQVGLLGAAVGPLVGLLFGWLFLPAVPAPVAWIPFSLGGWIRFAGLGGMAYSLVFYSIFGLAIPAVCAYYKLSQAARWLLGFAGWITALLVLSLVLPSGEWFSAAVRSRSIRLIGITTVLFVLLGIVRSAIDRARAQKAAAEAQAQVKSLQAQINPHFFFNTLNTIYALIAVDPLAAQRMVALLADMSRHAFATAQSELIPLAQELDFAETYLEIEKIRYGTRLQTEMPDRSKVDGIRVPALTVQPLIENAVRHGIARCVDGGKVSMEVDRNESYFSLTVANDCEPSTARVWRSFFREGHALENIRERLRLHFGDRASIEVASPRTDTVAVTVTGPLG